MEADTITFTGNSSSLAEADAKHSWHPYTQMQEYLESGSVHIVRGEGSWLYDIEGNKYLDGVASNWSIVHGHGDADLKQALIDQLEQIEQVSYKDQSHPAASLLAEKFAQLAPEGLTRCFYTDNGSCAIEAAMKMSFQYWQLVGQSEKVECIGLENGYHGDTIGTMAVGDSQMFHGRFKHWCFPAYHIPVPSCKGYGGKFFEPKMEESINALTKLLQERSDKIALMILEPYIQGPAGMQLMPPGFLKKVSNLCEEYDVHLILDEIFVGLGRTGTMFACEQEDVSPTMICLSKGLTGGFLPFGVTLAKEHIYEAFLGKYEEMKTFFHGHTFSANALTCAICLKNIEKLEAKLKKGSIQSTIKYFEKAITEAFASHPYIVDLRQRGMVCALELYPGKPGSSFDAKDRIAHKVSLLMRSKGIMARAVGNDLFFIPPLSITHDEIDFMCQRTSQSITEYIETCM